MRCKNIDWEFVYSGNFETLFKEMLLYEIHNTKGAVGVRSRMENIMTGDRSIEDGMTALIARNKDSEIVAAMFCEHLNKKDMAVDGIKLKNPFRQGSRVEKVYDWQLMCLGVVSIFVREDHRHKGLAGEAIKKMEEKRLDACVSVVDEKKDLFVPYFQAFGDALEIIPKYAKYAKQNTSSPINGVNFKSFNHDISHRGIYTKEETHTLLSIEKMRVELLKKCAKLVPTKLTIKGYS